MIEYLSSPLFWVGLGQVVLVNVLLSGDNAVVIALAARSLPPHQQKQAIIWGSVAAIVLRVILTIVAVEMLKLPYLKLIGSIALFWVAIQLLVPEGDGDDGFETSNSLFVAIRTILIADLVMSLDNVIGVAAAAKGDDVLVFIGLAISIPLIIFGSTVFVKLMDRFPVIITGGAALLGWVAGEMLITDPSIVNWIATNWPWMEMHWPLMGEVSWAQIAGALFVLAVGKIMTARAEKGEIVAEGEVEAPGDGREVGRKVLLLVDGSDCALRAAEYVARANDSSYKKAPEIHLLNVQRPFPGTVGGHVGAEKLHEDEGFKAIAAARKVLDDAKVSYSHHIGVGEPVDVVANFVRDQGIYSVIMGSHGAGAAANLLLGSFASKVLSAVNVPVVLVK